MVAPFKVVDLFAGPGGLAEGFSQFRSGDRSRPFDIALSIEKERSAFATLRLRSFFRQFRDKVPDDYYRYLAGNIDHSQLTSRFAQQWHDACEETLQLELGADGTEDILYSRLEQVRDHAGDNTILIGGPPCQAYSLVGRARNKGIADYVASDDHRHYLYKQYINIIGRLRPMAFVMENVKGILSASVDGDRIFPMVIDDLTKAGGYAGSYRLVPLVTQADHRGSSHVIEAERFGIPQCRHRVILFGVRQDAFPEGASRHEISTLQQHNKTTVADVIAGMPPLRSGLSRRPDDAWEWQRTVTGALRIAADAATKGGSGEVAGLLSDHAARLEHASDIPPRRSTAPGKVRDKALRDWLVDPRVTSMSNHETRGHMQSDLARYAFASTFAAATGRSPKANDYPAALAPDHANWLSGKFADRFRVQTWDAPSTTITSHISKDGHYFIHPDPLQCRSLTVREAARLQTFPDNYHFEGNRTQQFVQVGNAVPPLLARHIAEVVHSTLAGSN